MQNESLRQKINYQIHNMLNDDDVEHRDDDNNNDDCNGEEDQHLD